MPFSPLPRLRPLVLLFASLLPLTGGAEEAPSATLSLQIQGLRNASGDLRIALYDQAESFRKEALARRIVSQPALARFQPEEFKPGAQYQSDEELARLAGDIATTIFHPVGTTKMGRADDPMAVLDSRFKVRGVQDLRVVDAGAMPTITSGNTNSPTLMMAEKAAQWIRDAT